MCVYDVRNPRTLAYGIIEWIYAQMSVIDQEMTMVQIDGTKQNVSSFGTMDESRAWSIRCEVKYRHTNGVVSIVWMHAAGMGTRKVRIASFPPEV